MAFKKFEKKAAPGGKPKAGDGKPGPKVGRGGTQSSRGPSKFAKPGERAGGARGEGKPPARYGSRPDSDRSERYSPRGGASDRPPARSPRSRDDGDDRPKRSYASRDEGSDRPKRAYTPRDSDGPKRSYTPRGEGDNRRSGPPKPFARGAKTGAPSRSRPASEDRFERPRRAASESSYDRPKRASSSEEYDRPKRAPASSGYDRPKRASSSDEYDRPKRGASTGGYDRPKRATSDSDSDRPRRLPGGGYSRKDRNEPAEPSKIRSASFSPNKGLVKKATGVRSFYPDEKPPRRTTKRDAEETRPPSRSRAADRDDRPARSYDKPGPMEPRGKPAKPFVPRPRTGPKSATGASTYQKVERENEMASKPVTEKKVSPVAAASKSAGTDAAPEAAPVKPRTKLRAEDMRKLRDMMLQERQRIIEEMRILDDRSLQGSADENGQQPGFSLQLADSASDNIQIETDLGIRNIEAEQLSQLDEALRAMEGGNYGVCNRCHESISIERLFARPNARYCISCLKLLEAGKA